MNAVAIFFFVKPVIPNMLRVVDKHAIGYVLNNGI